MKRFLFIVISSFVVAVRGQYVTDVYTATTNEVNDGLNQTKPVTPWGLKNWIGGGSSGGITNNQTNVTLTGSFTETGGGNVVTNGQEEVHFGPVTIGQEPNTIGADFISDSALNPQGLDVANGSFRGHWDAFALTNLQSTNLVGILPMGTLTTLPVVTNGFLTTDGTNRSYSKNAQYLTNVQDSALSTNVPRLNASQTFSGSLNQFQQIKLNTGGNSVTISDTTPSAGGGLLSSWNLYAQGGTVAAYTDLGAGNSRLDWAISKIANGAAFSTNLFVPTINATNGFIGSLYGGTPQSSAPTLATIRAAGMNTNWGFMWWSNSIPPVKYSTTYDVNSNRVDIAVAEFQPRWVDALASGTTLQSGASAPAVRDLPGTWADSIAARGYSYDQGNWSSFSIQAPHVFATTNGYFPNFWYEPHVHISPNTSLATGTNATFVMQWQVSDVFGSFTGSPVICVTNTASFTNAAQHMVISFGNITNNALAGKASVIFRGSIRRAAAAVSDVGNTATTSPFVDSVDFHVPVRKLGTVTQYTGE